MAISKTEALRQLTRKLPKLTSSNFAVTSPPDRRYNCIAWAMGDNSRWWWPLDRYWPTGIPKSTSIGAFEMMLGNAGYTPTESPDEEDGFSKVAIYADPQQRVTHAARQVASGWWTSKLGPYIDISHTLDAIEGPEYGTVVLILKKPVTENRITA